MKKLLAILMLLALFVSCSDDDTTDPNNGNGNGKDMIDEKIIGKWKVEYSKTISPAAYNQQTGKVEHEEDARITEYLGNYGEIGLIISSGLFSSKEVDIEITKDKKVISNSVMEDPKTITFDSIKDGLFLKTIDYSTNIFKLKYRFDKEKLIIETITPEYNRYNYTISEYSKIKE